MCFNPAISLATFFVEIILAIFILWYYKKTTLVVFSSILLFVLGFYQFTEFMLCTTSYPLFWATVGFITYNFLPVIGLHAAHAITKRKFKYIIFYAFPVLCALFAIFYPQFIVQASCNRVFVTVYSIMTTQGLGLGILPSFVYGFYYTSYVILFCLIFIDEYIKNKNIEKNKNKRTTYLLFFISVLFMSIPTFIFLIIFPVLTIMFPSVLCHFALLMAITIFIAVYLENKDIE